MLKARTKLIRDKAKDKALREVRDSKRILFLVDYDMNITRLEVKEFIYKLCN